MGWSEFLVVIIVFFLLLGPKEIPGTVILCLRLMRKFKEIFTSFKEQIQQIVHEVEAQVYEEESRKTAAQKEPLMEVDWEILQKKIATQKESRFKKASKKNKTKEVTSEKSASL